MHLFIWGPDKNCCSTSQPDPNMESLSLIQAGRTIKFLCSFNPVPFQSKGWQLCPIFPNVCCYITLTNPPNSICAGPVDKNPIAIKFWHSLGLNPGFRGYRKRKKKNQHSKPALDYFLPAESKIILLGISSQQNTSIWKEMLLKVFLLLKNYL